MIVVKILLVFLVSLFLGLAHGGFWVTNPIYKKTTNSHESILLLDFSVSKYHHVCSSLPSKNTNTRLFTSSTHTEYYTDNDYPHVFTGRLWFSPAIVKIPLEQENPHPSKIQFLSLGGYTLGGTVVLEYDTSPVGPYFEYVTMSSLIYYSSTNPLSMGIGQWGSRLYVSNKQAEQICKDIWGVPAENANIQLLQEGNLLCIQSRPNSEELDTNIQQDIIISGWKHTRQEIDRTKRKWGPLSIQWTPTIKALWITPFSVLSTVVEQNTIVKNSTTRKNTTNPLPIHNLRLSASSLRMFFDFSFLYNMKKKKNNNTQESTWMIPLGLQLVVDNVMIEISSLKTVL